MTAIAIFVKTPGHSPLKTRLAADVGSATAEVLYMHSASAVAEVALGAQIGPVYWAVAEAGAMEAHCWNELPSMQQGGGSLGERMARVHSRLVTEHGSAILLGADAPQITIKYLGAAAQWLNRAGQRLVIGPATDGGFWLFGANGPIETNRWNQVSYSRPDTLQQFRSQLEDCGDWLELPCLTDLDTIDDIPRVAAELSRSSARLPRQDRLLELISRNPACQQD